MVCQIRGICFGTVAFVYSLLAPQSLRSRWLTWFFWMFLFVPFAFLDLVREPEIICIIPNPSLISPQMSSKNRAPDRYEELSKRGNIQAKNNLYYSQPFTNLNWRLCKKENLC